MLFASTTTVSHLIVSASADSAVWEAYKVYSFITTRYAFDISFMKAVRWLLLPLLL